MAGPNFSVKDPECLQITITPLSISGAQGAAIGGQLGFSRTFGHVRINEDRLVLRGIFAEDGDFARLESTNEEEDEYIETADGSVCITTRRQINKKLIIRINTCNDIVDQLIEMKNRRYGGTRIAPLSIHLCDLCTGYQLSSGCAFMLSNPTKSFGLNEEAQEIMFFLSDIKDDQFAFTNNVQSFSNLSNLGIDNFN